MKGYKRRQNQSKIKKRYWERLAKTIARNALKRIKVVKPIITVQSRIGKWGE